MATRVTLVRHGETERSKISAYSGRLDIALTETGRAQALTAGRQLTGAGVDVVITSPLSRARDTAQAIADATGAPLIVEPRLIEVDYGPFEGLNRDGASAKFGDAFTQWREDPWGSPVPGMEPLADALERVRPAVAEALAAHEHPLLVAHQGILRVVLVALGEIAPEDYFDTRLREAQAVVVANPAVQLPDRRPDRP